MSPRFAASLALIIILVSAGYFWWRGQAEQKITRQADLFIETIEFRKLSLTQPEATQEACRKIFGKRVEFSVPDPAPSGDFSLAEVIEHLETFHSYITYFEVEELARSIFLDGATAEVEIHGNFQIAAGPNTRHDESGTITLFFEKTTDWRIIGIKGLLE